MNQGNSGEDHHVRVPPVSQKRRLVVEPNSESPHMKEDGSSPPSADMHLRKQLKLNKSEEELTLAPHLEDFRKNPEKFMPRKEWFETSGENVAMDMRHVLFDSSSTAPSLPLPKLAYGEDRDSALHHCIRFSNYEAARKLIFCGAVVDVENLKGVSPLLLAAQSGQLSLVKLLRECGANESHASLNGATSVMQAAHFGHLPVVQYLVETNRDLLERSNHHQTTPFMRACQENHIGVVKYLYEAGADVNRKNIQGMTALMLASQRGNAEVCAFLAHRGAELNAMTEQKSTSLVLACKRQHLKTVEVLVRAGAELFVKDGRGRTAREICLHRHQHRRPASSTVETLQKLMALLDPNSQMDLMRLEARRERSRAWVRMRILLQQDRARIRGFEDRPFHKAIETLDGNRSRPLRTNAFLRTLGLPAPLLRHIAEFAPLPNHFDRRITLLVQRGSHDANAALMTCFDIIDELLEEWGTLQVFDQALVPPPEGHLSWEAWRRCRVRNSRVISSVTDIMSRNISYQTPQPEPRPNATVAVLRLPREPSAIVEHRRHAGYLQVLSKYLEAIQPILTSHPYNKKPEVIQRLALNSDICSVVRRLGWHSGCGGLSSSVAMDLILFTSRLCA